ncbi:MAG: hypothetical protein ABII97_03490 [Patescibacteria group bacterium]
MTKKTRKIILYISFVVFFVVAFVALLYSQGYSIDKNFNLSQKGGLYISYPFVNSDIFINNKKEKTTGMLNKSFFSSNLKTGEYSVLVAKDGFWPWAKTLEVKKGLVTEARAILIPENPKGELVFKGKFSNVWASPYEKILLLQEKKGATTNLNFYMPDEDTFLTPTSLNSEILLETVRGASRVTWEKDFVAFKTEKGVMKANINISDRTVTVNYAGSYDSKLISDFEKYTKRNREKIWWNPATNEVFADWLDEYSSPPHYMCDPSIVNTDSCNLPIQIFKGSFGIKKLDFYPKRKDVVIISVGNGVYALEIDGRGGRLAYPIYKGKEPFFANFGTENYIFVLDEGSLIKIYLE